MLKGGMGAIAQAMHRARRELGVEIATNATVARVWVSGQRANGTQSEDANDVNVDRAILNINSGVLSETLIAAADLDTKLNRRLDGYKSWSGTFPNECGALRAT